MSCPRKRKDRSVFIGTEDIVCAVSNGGFNDNHSIAYCLLGYLCGYYRYYHPGEFITSFLNNAANDDDITNGTLLARRYGIKVTSPRLGSCDGNYAYNPETKTISKGISSIRFVGEKAASAICEATRGKHYAYFTDALSDLYTIAHANVREVGVLLSIDFFAQFGNQRELERIMEAYDLLADAKSVNKAKVAGTPYEEIIARHAVGVTKAGKEAAAWTQIDIPAVLHEYETWVLSLGIPDVGVTTKVKRFADATGYAGYISGSEEDRPKLYVSKLFPVKRRRDGKQFGYNVRTQSIGSGKESTFTVFNDVYNEMPIKEGDVILCNGYRREPNGYFTLTRYSILQDD